jgi:hypothetical protein
VAALRRSRRPSEAVLDHVGDGDDLIVGLANGEPATVMDALEAGAGKLRDEVDFLGQCASESLGSE